MTPPQIVAEKPVRIQSVPNYKRACFAHRDSGRLNSLPINIPSALAPRFFSEEIQTGIAWSSMERGESTPRGRGTSQEESVHSQHGGAAHDEKVLDDRVLKPSR